MIDNAIVLNEDELAFFRMILEVFPAPESPLRFLDEEDRYPEDPQAAFASLLDRGLLDDSGTGASPDLRARLGAVSECRARVSMRVPGDESGRTVREFYVSSDGVVEHWASDGGHAFGPVYEESDLAQHLANTYPAAPEGGNRALSLSPGDYLVFAVFARDLRRGDEEAPSDTMTVDEVLSYFESPETPFVRTPKSDSWTQSVENLAMQRILVQRDDGYELHPSLHAFARELTADRQSTIHRFDFLDDQWLAREISLYPTNDTVYRLGTSPSGNVLIQELSVSGLADALGSVVGSLPDLLTAGAEGTSVQASP